MVKFTGKFRFAYFTDNYRKTCNFYKNKLNFILEHSWDRNLHDKGSLFNAGSGLVEILHSPENEKHRIQGLDYRSPQGAFLVIQVLKIDELYNDFRAKGIEFKQEIVDQDWGHRSFSVIDPNGMILMFIQESFDATS